MKRILNALFWPTLAMALALAVGCSNDRSDSNIQCDSYNNCYDSRTGMAYGGFGGFGRWGYSSADFTGNGYSQNRIQLSGRLEVISNPKLWQKAQMAIGICSDRVGPFQSSAFSSCMQGLPSLQIVIADYTFSGPETTSPGLLIIGTHAMGGYNTPQAQVVWGPANGNTGVASREIFTPYDRAGGLQVVLTGRVTDRILSVTLAYAGQPIGTGFVCRNGQCQ